MGGHLINRAADLHGKGFVVRRAKVGNETSQRNYFIAHLPFLPCVSFSLPPPLFQKFQNGILHILARIAFREILLQFLFWKADLFLLIGFFLAHYGKDNIRIEPALTGKATEPLRL